MAVVRDVFCLYEDFVRPLSVTTTPDASPFGWTIKDTSAAGTPTYVTIDSDSGQLKLLCDNTSEAQNVCLYQNDRLSINLAKIERVEFEALVAGVDAVTTIVFGIGSARNDTPDSVANLAWFRMEGSVSTSLVVVETDDGTNDNDDKATTLSLSTTPKKFVIDFSEGLADVRFYIDGARVAATTTFDMSNVSASTGRFQVIAQLQKASGTGVPALTLDSVKLWYKHSAGA